MEHDSDVPYCSLNELNIFRAAADQYHLPLLTIVSLKTRTCNMKTYKNWQHQGMSNCLVVVLGYLERAGFSNFNKLDFCGTAFLLIALGLV
jgi:hypothetical protein